MVTYSQFSESPERIEELLNLLGIVTYNEVFILINNQPDYDISEYQREVFSNYYFHNSWGFNHLFQSILTVDFLKKYIIHAEDINNLSKEYKVPYDYEDRDTGEFLMKVHTKDKDAIDIFGGGTEVGELKLNHLRVSSIDNIGGTINYKGSFGGDSSDIESVDYGFYSLVRITGIPNEITYLGFYKSLLAESYILYKEKKLKLAYFVAFSAFESFINANVSRKMNMKQKIKELFTGNFLNLEEDQISSSFEPHFFDSFEQKRNTIAHGKGKEVITKEEVENAFIFILSLISVFEFKCSTLNELNSRLKN